MSGLSEVGSGYCFVVAAVAVVAVVAVMAAFGGSFFAKKEETGGGACLEVVLVLEVILGVQTVSSSSHPLSPLFNF